MSRAPHQTRRERLIGPLRSAALAAMSVGGLSALHLWVGDRSQLPANAIGDALAVALLRADVDRHPANVEMRCRLAREQLALGLHEDAERTLAPFEESAQREVALLLLDVAVGAWRAAPLGSADRSAAEARALARVERLLARNELDDLARAAAVAEELGRPDVAAHAHERAAAQAGDPQQAMALGLQALDAYRAAGQGAEALRLADMLVERFPAERTVLERAEAAALAQSDVERARRFGANLMWIGAVDPVSLARQLDLDLAAGDLAAAVQVTELLAARSPEDPRARLTAARVAGWAGRADLALRHWTWLARHGAPDAIGQALPLARGVGDEGAVAQLLTLQSRSGSLPPASLAELADALDSSGPPRSAALVLERYAAVHSRTAAAWESLAEAQERRRDFTDALATRTEMERRFGASLANSIRVARLRWAVGDAGGALRELERFIDSAREPDSGYWELLADLAWRQEADALARRAYTALWEQGRSDAMAAERLLLLSRSAGRSDEVIHLGRDSWARLHQPRLLLLAMDEAARAGQWAELERLAGEAEAAGDVFASQPAYWLLRARLEEQSGKISAASEAYRKALAADPKSAAARSGLIWLLAGVHDRHALAECLDAWRADAPSEPGLWRAYGAGLEELGRSREALAFYQRDSGNLSLAQTWVAQQSAPWPSLAGADVGAETVGNILFEQQRVFVKTELSGAELEARAGVIGFIARDGAVPLPDLEKRVLLRAAAPGLGGRTEVAAGMSLRADGNVLQLAVARSQALASFGEARVEASLNEPADESAALRVEALRRRAGGAVAISAGPTWHRLAFDWKSWSTRSGIALGTGGSSNVEIGWRLRAEPDLSIRLQGGYQRNSVAPGLVPAAIAAFAPGAPVLPAELALLGLGVGAARVSLGPARLMGDAWLGWVGPPARPAFRVQTGIAVAPFSNADLALSAFAANDRWTSGGNFGVTLSLTHRFGL